MSRSNDDIYLQEREEPGSSKLLSAATCQTFLASLVSPEPGEAGDAMTPDWSLPKQHGQPDQTALVGSKESQQIAFIYTEAKHPTQSFFLVWFWRSAPSAVKEKGSERGSMKQSSRAEGFGAQFLQDWSYSFPYFVFHY